MDNTRKALAELVDTLQTIADIKDEKAGDELAFAQYLARRAIALSADTREEARQADDYGGCESCGRKGGRHDRLCAARPSEPELRITGGGKVSVDPAAVLARHKADTDARPMADTASDYIRRKREQAEKWEEYARHMLDKPAARPSAEEAQPVAQEPVAYLLVCVEEDIRELWFEHPGELHEGDIVTPLFARSTAEATARDSPARDAARYRWLRERIDTDDVQRASWVALDGYEAESKAVDAAIDAAMAPATPKGEPWVML